MACPRLMAGFDSRHRLLAGNLVSPIRHSAPAWRGTFIRTFLRCGGESGFDGPALSGGSDARTYADSAVPPAIDVPVDPRLLQQRAWHERRLPPHGSASAAAGGRYRPKPLISSTVSSGSGTSVGRRGGGKKEIFCAFGIDVDAVAGWLGSYGGEDSPCDISRGLFSGEVGVPRLVELFRRFGIRTTWFIPGHSVETFPDQCRRVADAGHEIGVHGYSHENPIAMTREQETAVLDKCIDLIEKLSGRRPTGYVAPWWEFSP